MGRVISIPDYRAERLQESLDPSHFDNIYDFLRARFGESTDEWVIELYASMYREICHMSNDELDYSIVVSDGKTRKALRNF